MKTNSTFNRLGRLAAVWVCLFPVVAVAAAAAEPVNAESSKVGSGVSGASPKAAPEVSTSASVEAKQGTLGLFEEVLKQPRRRLLMSEVQNLDSGTEAELTRRFEKAESLHERIVALRFLAYAGSERVTGLATNLLLRDYAGRSPDADEEHKLCEAAALLGFAARKDDAALAFLLASLEPGFLKRMLPWKTEANPGLHLGAYAYFTIWGLVVSGRSEAKAALDALKDDLERVADLGASGALGDAAFWTELIRERGLAGAVDLDDDQKLRRFGQWYLKPGNGPKWDEFVIEVEQVRRSREQ
jgi:hypothetical protein